MSFAPLADHGLRRWQLALMRAALVDPTEIIAIRGGLGSGKSAAEVYLAEAVAVTRPGAKVAIVTDTGRRVIDNIQPICQAIFPSTGGRYRASDREWHWPNGSSVRLRMYYSSGIAGQNALEGATYACVVVDEAQTLPPDILDRAGDRARQYLPDLSGVVRPPLIVLAGIPCEPCWWVERARETAAEGKVKVAIFLPRTADNLEAYGEGWLAQRRAMLGKEQFEALYENNPRPAVGNIYDCWAPHAGEGGNLVAGWRLTPDMRVAVVADPGKNKPATIAAAYDEALEAWVIFDEWSPTQDSVRHQVPDAYALAERMLERWWPRRWASCCPRRNPVLVDEMVGDPAAKVAGERDNLDYYQKLRLPPPGALQGREHHGFGLPVHCDTDKGKQSIRAGITRTRAAMQRGQLLMTQELWDRGRKAKADAHTLAKSLLGYAYGDDGKPVKDTGFDDFADCVRYLVRRHLWFEDGTEGRSALHHVTRRPVRRERLR